MADIKPFRAIRYATDRYADLSPLIAPPYDVLDEAGKNALLSRSAENIVKIDLPYLPPKTVGPDAVYENAAATLQQWLNAGVLRQDDAPALYAYTQTFTLRGRTFSRRGFIALVKLEEFSTPKAPTQVVPHEKTYKGPIEDRMKLMRATGVQLSPIFGLFPDGTGEVTEALYADLGLPQVKGSLDGVLSELWPVTDAATQQRVIDAMKTRKVYIADGHHRYTTALGYKKELGAKLGHALPPEHPANYCLFVLVSMHEPGCVILPTHRIVGGLKNFSIDALRQKLDGAFTINPIDGDEHAMASFEDGLATAPPNTFGLFDGQSRKLYLLQPTRDDLLKAYEPNQSSEWRALDVAILRRYLLDEIIGPTFADTPEVNLAYTADPEKVPAMTDGTNYQIAILLRPTPLIALEQLGNHGEVMPQKSTYFFPKLATGMVINSIE